MWLSWNACSKLHFRKIITGSSIERISDRMKNREYVQEVYQYIHEKQEIAFEEVRTSDF